VHLSERLRAVRSVVGERDVHVGFASSAANTPSPTCAMTIGTIERRTSRAHGSLREDWRSDRLSPRAGRTP
jgi:hypothetical protein